MKKKKKPEKIIRNQKINMKVSVLIILGLFVTMIVSGQKVEPIVKELVIANLISYHIRYALEYDLRIENKHLIAKGDCFFHTILSKDRELVMEIQKTELSYPIKGYELYHFLKKGFRFQRNDSLKSYSISSFSYDDDYLIAYNSTSKDIKYISGNLFRTKISNDFSLDKDRPISFERYLQMKFFNFHLKDIRFKMKKKGKLCFSGQSKLDDRLIDFEVDAHDFDDITVRQGAVVR